jgi:asparagine N-glycosylation enzyme membrane subunit Stt3
MSLGPELLPQNNPELWGGPWYAFPLMIFLFLAIFFVLAVAERRIFDSILYKIRNAGTRIEFNNLRSLKRHISESKVAEGYKWLANNTEGDATILAWWDYAANIQTLSHRNVVIKGASRNIKDTIESIHKHSWSWIKYALWYPFESEKRVKEVANFFVAENELEAMEIAREYNANYVLAQYPWDVYKFKAMVVAAGKNPDDYIASTVSPQEIENRTIIKRDTVGMKMIYGDEVEGFEKVFDNELERIYKFNKVG